MSKALPVTSFESKTIFADKQSAVLLCTSGANAAQNLQKSKMLLPSNGSGSKDSNFTGMFVLSYKKEGFDVHEGVSFCS